MALRGDTGQITTAQNPIVRLGFVQNLPYLAENRKDMEQQLQFIPFKSPADKGWQAALELYSNSFPYKEQRSEADFLQALEDPHFEADGIWRGDEFIGILYHWRTAAWYYLEHLAISPALRGQNMGSKALSAFCEGKRVILEIDPPVDDISIRRLHFYQRLGFIENPQEYIHPSFRHPFEHHKLVLMSYPTTLTNDEARDFADFIRETVLLYSEHENPTMPKLR